jgi:hypothetical protein
VINLKRPNRELFCSMTILRPGCNFIIMRLIRIFFTRGVGFLQCACIYLIFTGCNQNAEINITVTPKHFKIEIPYETDRAGIILNTFWGADRIRHKLYLDNNSPTWANDRVIQNNRSVSKSKNISYRSTVADGSFIKGDVYICDSLSLGQVTFNHFAFYKISGKSYAGKTELGEGVIGDNLLSIGIWKIDFRNKKITFASSLDSIGELQNVQILPSTFTNNTIEVELQFPHKKAQTFELDLGFNGMLIMPLEEFVSFEAGKKIYADSFRFATPSGFELVENRQIWDTVKIGQKLYFPRLDANKSVKEKLIGLHFFEQFEFLILDYVNKSVYISKKSFY